MAIFDAHRESGAARFDSQTATSGGDSSAVVNVVTDDAVAAIVAGTASAAAVAVTTDDAAAAIVVSVSPRALVAVTTADADAAISASGDIAALVASRLNTLSARAESRIIRVRM